MAGGVYVFNNHENLEDNLLDYYKHYGINGQTQQSTTHGLDMDGYLSSVAQTIPILESALTGGYVGAPLDINNNGELNSGMFIKDGFITGKNFLGMANYALNGIYEGIYDTVTESEDPAFAAFAALLPCTPEQFATMPDANRLAILDQILYQMADLQLEIEEDSDLWATVISGFVDTMYGMVGAIAPAESWRGIQGLADSITAIVESEDELSVKFEKLTAVYSAIGTYALPTTWATLQAEYLGEWTTAQSVEAKVLALHNALSVVKGSTLMSALTNMMTYANSIAGENNYGAGSYLNLYFNAGRMGALVGLYPAPEA